MLDIDDATAPAPALGIEEIPLDDELVLYDHATGAVHALDRLATITWRCLDGTTTVGELVADLADAFGADEEVVRGDVTGLLVQLAAKNLIGPGDERPPPVAPDERADGRRLLVDPPDP